MGVAALEWQIQKHTQDNNGLEPDLCQIGDDQGPCQPDDLGNLTPTLPCMATA